MFGDDKLQVHPHFNIKVLGSFIGTPEFIRKGDSDHKGVEGKIAKVLAMLEAASSLDDPHCAMLLISNCFDSCRMTYLMRTIDHKIIAEQLLQFDNNLKNAIDLVMGRTLTDIQFKQLTQSISDKGHGVQTSKDTSSAAYLASLQESEPFVLAYLKQTGTTAQSLLAYSESIADTQQSFFEDYDVPIDADCRSFPASQHQLSRFVRAQRIQSIEDNMVLAQKVRYQSAGAPCAGNWIRSIPRTNALRMSPHEYRSACALRYGWIAFPEHTECIDCGKVIDKLGAHALHCSSGGEAVKRHNQIRDLLADYLAKGQFIVEREKPGLFLEGRKPADIYVTSYHDRIDYAFDVTVVSSFRYDLIKKAAHESLVAAQKGADVKYNKYKNDLHDSPFKLQPIAFEASGGFSIPAQMLIKKIADAVSSRYGMKRCVIAKKISDEISVILLRSAARMVLRRKVEKLAM